MSSHSFRAVLVATTACLCGCSAQPTLTIMSYNAHNAFDAVAQGTEYPEYDPKNGKWSSDQVDLKIDALAEVIRKATPGGPDVLALQEVENKAVLERLVTRLPAGYDYRVMAPDHPNGCAILSRLPLTRVGLIGAGHWSDNPLRSMLESTIVWRGQPIRLVTIHWKSRLGGAAETVPARAQEAAALRRRLLALAEAGADRALLVIGDFNTDSAELAPLTAVLNDLWLSAPPLNSPGSYVYRGRWQSPDRVLLSPDLTDGIGLDILPASFRVFAPSFMTDPDTGYPLRGLDGGWRYSDHLPILVEFVSPGVSRTATRPVSLRRSRESEDQ